MNISDLKNVYPYGESVVTAGVVVQGGAADGLGLCTRGLVWQIANIWVNVEKASPITTTWTSPSGSNSLVTTWTKSQGGIFSETPPIS